MRRSAGWLGAATVVLGPGCTTHRLSRDPDPPLSGFDQAVVWAAAASIVVMLTALVVRALVRPGRPFRAAAGSVIVSWLAAAALGVAVMVGMVWRTGQLLGGGECRGIPVEARPETIIELSCTEGSSSDWGLVLLLLVPVLLGGAMLGFLLALPALRGRQRWTARASALFLVVTASLAIRGALQHGLRGGDDVLALVWAGSAIVAAALLAVDATLNPAAPPPAAPPAPSGRHRGRRP